MKNLFKKIIGLTLILALCMTPLARVSAATTRKYVSDMKISYNSDGDAAKKELVDAGYTVIKQDLNDGAASGLSKKRVVYMGYKTTTNPEEAITDVAMMSEECGYSFSDYQDLLKEQYAKYEKLAKLETDVLKEFRAAYKNDSPLAKSAYTSLNNFKEDDSGKLVGDFLLDENLSEDNLIKFMTQISSYTLDQFNELLASSISEKSTNSYLTRLSKLSQAEIDQLKTKDDLYYDSANIMYGHLSSLKNTIKSVEGQIVLSTEKEKPLTDEEKAQLDEMVKEQSDELAKYVDLSIYVGVYASLKETKYGSKTLYDILMDDDFKISSLYPLVSVMTKGQIASIEFIGFEKAFSYIGLQDNKEDIVELSEDMNSKEDVKVISAYYGVDRSMFTDAVAITSAATRQMNSTNDKSPLWGNVKSDTEIALAITAGVAAGAAVLSFGSLFALATKTAYKLTSATGGSVFSKVGASYIRMGMEQITNPKFVMSRIKEIRLSATTKMISVSKAVLALNIIGYAAIAIAAIVSTVLLVLELYNYYNPKYSKVPKILLDMIDNEDMTKYIRYDGVTTVGGEMGDINGYAGKKWNAIYTTKDKNAGKPILANSVVFYDTSKTPNQNYKGVHNFGSDAAVNLNNYTFGGEKDIYLYLAQDLSYQFPSTASVFATSVAIPLITGVSGLILGVLLSTLFFVKKRKKKTLVDTDE